MKHINWTKPYNISGADVLYTWSGACSISTKPGGLQFSSSDCLFGGADHTIGCGHKEAVKSPQLNIGGVPVVAALGLEKYNTTRTLRVFGDTRYLGGPLLAIISVRRPSKAVRIRWGGGGRTNSRRFDSNNFRNRSRRPRHPTHQAH